MTALFIMNLVFTFAHFMIAFLRILVIYGKWEALKTLVSIGAYLFKTCRKVLSKNHICQLHFGVFITFFKILSLN